MTDKTKRWALAIGLIVSSSATLVADEPADLAANQPRPSYANVPDIHAMAKAVRQSQPAAQRGAWEWDRLLSRYVDGGRQERNAIIILQAYFRSILDRQGKGERYDTFFAGHGAWGSGGRLRIYEELVRQNMLTADEQAKFRKIVSHALTKSFEFEKLERSANNRPFGMNGGPAIALRIFPKLPQAAQHRRWLDALWRELEEYGDTTETNYFPYGPIYLDGFLDMAEGMGKLKTERDFIHDHVSRYLDYVHGGGVRGNPNSVAMVNSDRDQAYADPWNSVYYQGGQQDAQVWYRLAKEFRSAEFLWASEQACLGGRPPVGRETPAAYLAAYQQRYAWFVQRGMEPQAPQHGAKIGYYSPRKHKVPERLYLCPSRESGKPFASFYLYDRNNNYMHYNDDVMGQLYEYAVDGAKFLHTSGKYNSNTMKLPAAYDALWVQHPAVDFATGRMGDIPYGTWKTASMPLAGLLNSRHGPDSRHWKYDGDIGLFRRADDDKFGYAHGNMDGYWYLNNEFHLDSLAFQLVDPVVELRIPLLSGPQGDQPLFSDWKQAPKRFTVTSENQNGEQQVVWKGGDPLNASVSLRDTAAGPVLRIRSQPNTRCQVRLQGIDMTFNAVDDYTRLLIEHNGRITSGSNTIGARGGHQAAFKINERMEYLTYDSRGGILERESLRAENRHADSFGQFRYRNYFGAHSHWTRQTVLTHEGYLVVRDAYEPGKQVAGYHAGPCWLLRPDRNWKEDDRADRGPVKHDPKRHWFDAPAWDHAWWQTQPKRVLLWMHPGDGQTFGVTAHATSADISRPLGFEYYPTQNSHAKAVLKAGHTEVFLSVFVPFDAGRPANEVARTIQTEINASDQCIAHIGSVHVTINPDGSWLVKR